MSTLFTKNKNIISLNPVALYIPAFGAVWEKYEDKNMAEREFAYIYYVSDYKSDYCSYGNDMELVVARDIMWEGWRPDEITQAAVEKYKDLQNTTSMRFLIWARMGISTVTDYFKSIAILEGDSEDVRERKMRKFDPSTIVKLLKDVEPILSKLDNIEEKVMKEEDMGENKIRGGGDIGFFENPEAMDFLKVK